MSLKDLKETYGKKEAQGQTTGASKTFNLPVKVTGYEGETLIGIDLNTNTEVKVELRDLKNANENSKYPRPKISDFANKKHKRYAEPEKTIVVAESAYLDKNGVYQARWIKVVSADQDVSKVKIFMGSYLMYQRKKGDETEEITFVKLIYPEHAKVATSLNEVSLLLAKYLRPKTPGSNPLCFIRVKDADDTVVMEVKPLREKDEDGHNRVVSGEASAKKFLEGDESLILRKVFESESEMKVEVIPGTVIFPGSATRDQIAKMKDDLKKALQEAYYVKAEANSEGENSLPQSGFLPTVLAMREYEDHSPFFTYCRQLVNYEDAKLVDDLKTANDK